MGRSKALLPLPLGETFLTRVVRTLLDAGVVVSLVKVTWPDADFHGSGLRSRIIDAAYPNSDATQFSDQDFDDGIAQMLADGWG